MLSNNEFLQEIQQKYQINIRTTQTKIFQRNQILGAHKTKTPKPKSQSTTKKEKQEPIFNSKNQILRQKDQLFQPQHKNHYRKMKT